MAWIQIDWSTMTAYDTETGFVFRPGYMRCEFAGDLPGYVEFILVDGIEWIFLVHW